MQFAISIPPAVLLFCINLFGQSATPATQPQTFHVRGTNIWRNTLTRLGTLFRRNAPDCPQLFKSGDYTCNRLVTSAMGILRQ